MGCDMHVYVPDGDADISWSYSTFNRIRARIILEFVKLHGDEPLDLTDDERFALLLGMLSSSLSVKIAKMLEDMCTPESEAMLDLLNHSDCEGVYYDETCEGLCSALKDVIAHLDEDDKDRDYIIQFYELYRHAFEKDGIVVVY